MADVLLDTDVLIDHLTNKTLPLPASVEGAAFSSISRAELYSGAGADEAVIDQVLMLFEEIEVDRAIAEEAGRIRRTTKVKLPDAIIAATAIVSKRALYTRNLRDFKRIKRLKLHRG